MKYFGVGFKSLSFTKNAPGVFIALMVFIQFFSSNSVLINSGFNHTLVIQLFISIVFLFYLLRNDPEKCVSLLLIQTSIVLFFLTHYHLLDLIFLEDTPYDFTNANIFSYLKYTLYSFIFLVIYYFFKREDLLIVLKVIKYLSLALFLELFLNIIWFLINGFNGDQSISFIHSNRFAGALLKHNTLLSMFAYAFILYSFFLEKKNIKYVYIAIGILLVVASGERSSIIGLTVLLSSIYIYVNNSRSPMFYIKTLLLFVSMLFILLLFINFLRDVQNIDPAYLRPLTLRLYFSFLSFIHVLDVSIIGLGPYSHVLPTNIELLYQEEVSSFANYVYDILNFREKMFIMDWHNYGAHLFNGHNTFVLLFYYFGVFFVFLAIYLSIVLFNGAKSISKWKKDSGCILMKTGYILPPNNNILVLISFLFIIASTPSLLFLSMDNYLILYVIFFGYVASNMRRTVK